MPDQTCLFLLSLQAVASAEASGNVQVAANAIAQAASGGETLTTVMDSPV